MAFIRATEGRPGRGGCGSSSISKPGKCQMTTADKFVYLVDIYWHQLSLSRRQRNASSQADPSLTGTLILLLVMETGSLNSRVVFVKYFINSQKRTLFCANYHLFFLCSRKWMGPVIHRSSLLYLINPCSCPPITGLSLAFSSCGTVQQQRGSDCLDPVWTAWLQILILLLQVLVLLFARLEASDSVGVLGFLWGYA